MFSGMTEVAMSRCSFKEMPSVPAPRCMVPMEQTLLRLTLRQLPAKLPSSADSNGKLVDDANQLADVCQDDSLD
jgi:hypothetical protein